MRDLRLRLAGLRKPVPTARQQAGWGGWRVPWWLTIIVYCLAAGAMMYADRISLSQALSSSDWWAGGVLLAVGIMLVSTRIDRYLAVNAYSRRLAHSARFFLLEYDAYLGREIVRATQDSALGGPAEIERLEQVRQRIAAVLTESRADTALTSSLAHEIATAERTLRALAGDDMLSAVDPRPAPGNHDRGADQEQQPAKRPGSRERH